MPARKSQPLDVWTAVDEYFGNLIAPTDAELDATLKANRQAGLPDIGVSRLQGKFLHVLVQMLQPRKVLEIGTLGGYSTLWMARALPQGGRIITLEFEPRHAEAAGKNLKNAGMFDRVEIRVGRALDTLPALVPSAPFDLIFIDADKPSNPRYFEWAMKLARPGAVIAVDNVVREGEVADAKSKDENVQGTRRMAELMAAEPRLSATVLQTVGAKGYDGFLIGVVRP